MAWFFNLGNRYAENSDWKDFALVKFCLFAMGVLVGTNLDAKYKKKAGLLSIFVFLSTYIPLMLKVFKTAKEMD